MNRLNARTVNTALLATALAFFAPLGHAAGSPPAVPVAPAAENRCAAGSRSMLVMDDAVNVRQSLTDQARAFQLPSAAQAMQAQEPLHPCLLLLDNDPVFWTMPGAVQPDFILRVRITELKAAEKSLGDKAGSAVGRYIGSYLGQAGDDVPALKFAAVAVDVLCPKARRRVATISGQSAEIEAPRVEHNALRLQQALEATSKDLADFLTASVHPCQSQNPSIGGASQPNVAGTPQQY